MKRCLAVFVLLAALPRLEAANVVSERFYTAIREDDARALAALIAEGADINVRDDHRATPLMYAAAVGSTAMMRRVLDAGADVNARTSFDATALMWCTNQFDKVKLLIGRGADVTARSQRGRTPLLIAASHDGNFAVVRLLLTKEPGLVNAADKVNSTPLLEAISANDTASAKLLLASGADAKAKNIAGLNALMFAAANGNAELVRILLARGIDVNEQTGQTVAPPVKNGLIALGKLSPLMMAAGGGSAEIVRLLRDAGADVNAQDVRGMTPQMFAVATDHPDETTIRALLARKPLLNIKSNRNETALDWSAKFQQPAVMTAMYEAAPDARLPGLVSAALRDASGTRSPQEASEKGIALLQKASDTFFKQGACVSCHAQNMTMIAAGTARRKGVRFDEAAQVEMTKALRYQFAALGDGVLERVDPPAVDILTYALYALSMNGAPPDRVTDVMIHNLAAEQSADGSWGRSELGIRRPPTSDMGFTATAMAIRALKVYGPRGRKAEMEERVARGLKSLMAAQPRTTEDAVMQLLGAKWAEADEKTIERLTKNVLALQREDGGWAQTPYLKSDAYATGTALYALNEANGYTSAQPAYRRGTQFLLGTQAPDGSWFVASRAPKFQPYFDGGFPYGHDQWISELATGWASVALALQDPERRTAR